MTKNWIIQGQISRPKPPSSIPQKFCGFQIHLSIYLSKLFQNHFLLEMWVLNLKQIQRNNAMKSKLEFAHPPMNAADFFTMRWIMHVTK